ncbi:hypothetical protein Tco_0217989 [Tanacetum coccineum]
MTDEIRRALLKALLELIKMISPYGVMNSFRHCRGVTLVPPPGFEGRKGLVIKEPESGIFFYNGNFDLVFQREEVFHLATTTQLIRLHNSIQRGSPKAEEMFAKLVLTIDAREDVVEAILLLYKIT